jgi:hypothetical protein
MGPSPGGHGRLQARGLGGSSSPGGSQAGGMANMPRANTAQPGCNRGTAGCGGTAVPTAHMALHPAEHEPTPDGQWQGAVRPAFALREEAQYRTRPRSGASAVVAAYPLTTGSWQGCPRAGDRTIAAASKKNPKSHVMRPSMRAILPNRPDGEKSGSDESALIVARRAIMSVRLRVGRRLSVPRISARRTARPEPSGEEAIVLLDRRLTTHGPRSRSLPTRPGRA